MQVARGIARLAFPTDIRELIGHAPPLPTWTARPDGAVLVLALDAREDLQITVEVMALTSGLLVNVTDAYR